LDVLAEAVALTSAPTQSSCLYWPGVNPGFYESAHFILQLYDNSVYQVGGPGGVRHLPTCDRQGRYHIDGTLQVADKSAIKEMTAMLSPIIKALGQARKAFLAPLTRYWIRPCCDNSNHHLNYSSPSYLPALGASVFRLRDYIRDALYTRRTGNFRVVCANKLMGIGPHLSDQAASDISKLWGGDAVHPLPEAYDALTSAIERDILMEDARYINPPKQSGGGPSKRFRTDFSKTRQQWVEGCSAAVPRRDTYNPSAPRNNRTRGRGGGGGTGTSYRGGRKPFRGSHIKRGGWRGK
jgi:hypothetical protein